MEGTPRERKPPIVAGNGAARSAVPIAPVGTVNILLVDDRPDKLLALEAILEPLGQNLVKALSGKEALRLLLKQEFAVILLDVSMPGLDGFETASFIRKRQCTEHTPIIFITSVGSSPAQMYQGYSLGAVDYILTPIVPDVLRAKVSVFIELWKKTEQVRTQSERLRQIEEAEHRRQLADAADRLDAETKRNRFFTLALDMLGIGDFKGRLLQVNPAWQNILGYSNGDLIGMTPADLVHPEDLPLMTERLELLRNGESVDYFEVRCRRKDGSHRWIGWTAAAFREEQLIYVFGRDITARKEAEAEICKLNKELESRVAALTDINRELEAFNYSISHDLRAPLRSMNGFAQALLTDEGDKLGPTAQDFARRIVRSGKYMDSLLHDLLAYSRLSRMEIKPAALSLDEAVNGVLGELDHEIHARGASVDLQTPLGTVSACLPALKQVLLNLINNALKFVPATQSPRLRVYTTAGEGTLRLWIEDNGIGIAPEHHERIFGLFERLHDTRAYAGTGVGLALVRKAAERMGGRAGLESTPGQGSRFWVDLPAVQTQPE